MNRLYYERHTSESVNVDEIVYGEYEDIQTIAIAGQQRYACYCCYF